MKISLTQIRDIDNLPYYLKKYGQLMINDNNIELNSGGDHTTAIGGGITVLSGQSNTLDSKINTDLNGKWLITPSLESPIISGGTFYGDGSNLIGINNNYLTGATINNSNLILERNGGLSDIIVDLSGITVNNSQVIFGQGFDYQTKTNIVNINTTNGYVTNELTAIGHSYNIIAPSDGLYRLGVKHNYTSNSTGDSVKTRWYVNNTPQTVTTELELKDNTDDITWANFFYVSLTQGTHTVDVRFAGEKSSNIITLSSSSIEFWRVA